MGLRNLLEPQPPSYEKKKQYKFHKLLGQGTFGEVKQATWTRKDGSKMEVAVKCIDKSLVKSKPETVYGEMSLLQELDNPHIVTIFDWFESKEKFFLVFELVPGGELFERIVQRKHFSEHDAATCINAILAGVAYLHSKTICHRDLKPENLLLRSKDDSRLDDIVIADFGVARHLGIPPQMNQTLVGSPGYSAPELFCEDGYEGMPADIWSIGVITYAMLSGTTPFDHKDPEGLLKDQMRGSINFDKKRDIWKGISEEAKDFIQQCCHVEPKKRPTAEQALKHPWLLHECKRSSHNIGETVKDQMTRSTQDGGGSFFVGRPLDKDEQELDEKHSGDNVMEKLKNKIAAVEV